MVISSCLDVKLGGGAPPAPLGNRGIRPQAGPAAGRPGPSVCEAGPPPNHPQEPRLLPRLRIQFADFPWPHYPVTKRYLTEESEYG